MRKLIFLTFLAFLIASCSGRKEQTITILLTTDLHGVILPYDFIEKEAMNVSLAGVSTYVRNAREG